MLFALYEITVMVVVEAYLLHMIHSIYIYSILVFINIQICTGIYIGHKCLCPGLMSIHNFTSWYYIHNVCYVIFLQLFPLDIICYIILLLNKTLDSFSLAYLWLTLSLIFKCLSIGMCWFGFDTVSYSSGTNMALTINDNPIQYYNMDAFRSITSGLSHFLSPDSLVIKSWICAALLFLNQIILTRLLE